MVWGVPVPRDEQPAASKVRASLTLGMSPVDRTAVTTIDCSTVLVSRQQAISVPSVKRSRDLIVSIAASMPFTFWRKRPITEESQRIEPATWAERPDPARTRQWIVSWTVDDLIFHGRAYWRVRDRTAAGFPSSFELMRAASVQVEPDLSGVRWTVGARTVRVPAADVVEFLSPLDPVLVAGARAIGTAIKLDGAAERHADHDVPSGWLEMDAEPPDWVEDDEGLADFLSSMASAWHTARLANSTGALPQGLHYRESGSNPERLQLTEGRQHSAVEITRVMDVPGWFVSANVAGSSLTYQNAQQAHTDAIDFGAAPYIRTIEETLSGPGVTPMGNFVKLDPTEWLDVSTPALAPTEQPTQENADA